MNVVTVDFMPMAGACPDGLGYHWKYWKRSKRAQVRANHRENALLGAMQECARLESVDAVVLVDGELLGNERNWAVTRDLIKAYESCGLNMAVPIPDENRSPMWERHVFRVNKKKVTSVFFVSVLGCSIFSRDTVERLVKQLPVRTEANLESPYALDYEICRLVGGLAPVRLVIERPIGVHWVTCTESSLSMVPDVMGPA